MRTLLLSLTIVSVLIFASCDVQSGITKKSVEKFVPTPTPATSPTPVETPVDPADVITVDTSDQGPTISINSQKDKMNVVCNKYNRVMVNGGDKVVSVRGGCSQIMINGARNSVTAEAVAEIVFNGVDNKVTYTKYVNGKRPFVTDSTGGNVSEKAEPATK